MCGTVRAYPKIKSHLSVFMWMFVSGESTLCVTIDCQGDFITETKWI